MLGDQATNGVSLQQRMTLPALGIFAVADLNQPGEDCQSWYPRARRPTALPITLGLAERGIVGGLPWPDAV